MDKKYEDLLQEIRELDANYLKMVEGRKETVEKIFNIIKEIRSYTNAYNKELNEIEKKYQYCNYYVSDHSLVMSLLLRLANSNEERYAMKEVSTVGYYDINDETKKYQSKIIFISEKSLVDKIEDYLYFMDEFKQKAIVAINRGFSMMLITSNLFEPNVKPLKKEVMCDSIVDFRNMGILGNITCYLNSVELHENVNKLVNYININGPDFRNIDEDTLFEKINVVNKTQKTLTK